MLQIETPPSTLTFQYMFSNNHLSNNTDYLLITCPFLGIRINLYFKRDSGDFPGGPVAKTPSLQCRRLRFNPWSGNQIPYAATKSLHATVKYPSCPSWASLVAQMVKGLPTKWETWVCSLGWEDPLEKEMATHSSTLAWKIPQTEESGRLQSMESQRVRHNLATKNNKEFSCLCIAQQSPLKVSSRRPKKEGSGHSRLNTESPPSAAPTCAVLGLSPSHHPRWQSQIRLADTRSTPGQRGEPNSWKEQV